jgi:hypothetical protein
MQFEMDFSQEVSPASPRNDEVIDLTNDDADDHVIDLTTEDDIPTQTYIDLTEDIVIDLTTDDTQ